MQPREGIQIIYVDDECNALLNCRSTIRDMAEITSAHFFQQPKEAIEFAMKNTVDVAFLDVDLGEICGFTLGKQMKLIRPKMKVVYVTGNIEYMDVKNRRTDAPFVFKPYSRADIIAVLERVYRSVK